MFFNYFTNEPKFLAGLATGLFVLGNDAKKGVRGTDGRSRVPLHHYVSVLFVFIVLLASTKANAMPVYARAWVSVGNEQTTQPQDISDGGYVTNSVALSAAQGYGSASSRGAPGYGGVSSLIASDYSGLSRAESTLKWEDNWLMSPVDTSLIGRQARVYPVLVISGSGTAQSVVNSYARAIWGLTVRVGTTNTGIAGGIWDSYNGAGVTYTGDPIGQEIVGNGFLMPLGYSTDISFNLYGNTKTECTGGCSGYRSASVDLSNTLNWVGLVVKDPDDQLIEDFTITSASGVDYSQPVPPVPVPGAMWLFGSGLLGLVGLRRRLRR